jgi:hypothetical protein
MKHADSVVTFDVPAALLELLYVRAALDLDVLPGVPQLASGPTPGDVPEGATAAWDARYQALVGQSDLDPSSRTGILDLLEDELRITEARSWVNRQREVLIAEVMTPKGGKDDLFIRRREALQGTDVERIYVAPLAEKHMSRVGPGTLLVSVSALVDDDAWRSAG